MDCNCLCLTKLQVRIGGPSDQILDLYGPVLNAGGKPERLEKSLRKQVWTGNQVHKCLDRGSNPGLIGAKLGKIICCANLLPHKSVGSD